MRTLIALLSLWAASAAYGQVGEIRGDMRSKEDRPKSQAESVFRLERPNEIKRGRITYSGVFVQVVKTKKPLQLINPAAPPETGSSELNIARNAITQRPTGVKLFSLSF